MPVENQQTNLLPIRDLLTRLQLMNIEPNVQFSVAHYITRMVQGERISQISANLLLQIMKDHNLKEFSMTKEQVKLFESQQMDLDTTEKGDLFVKLVSELEANVLNFQPKEN